MSLRLSNHPSVVLVSVDQLCSSHGELVLLRGDVLVNLSQFDWSRSPSLAEFDKCR